MTEPDGWIPEEEYKKIESLIPFACVDVFVVCGDEFFLGKRAIEPAKNEWWPAGGRIIIGERMEEAIAREAKEEFGIDADPSSFEFLLTKETIFNKPDGSITRHTVNSAFKLELKEKPTVRLKSGEFSEVRWFDAVDPTWHPYVRLCLHRAGFQ